MLYFCRYKLFSFHSLSLHRQNCIYLVKNNCNLTESISVSLHLNKRKYIDIIIMQLKSIFKL